MTERLDKVKKYIELLKASDSRSKEANIYWSKATDILTAVDATVKKEEIKELESLAHEMITIFYNSVEISEYKRRGSYFY